MFRSTMRTILSASLALLLGISLTGLNLAQNTIGLSEDEIATWRALQAISPTERPNAELTNLSDLAKKKKQDPKAFDEFMKQLSTVPAFVVQMALARFGYGVLLSGELDERTKLAIIEYQKRRGLKHSGQVDAATVERAVKDMRAADYNPIDLPTGAFSFEAWSQGYIAAAGTWVMTNETPAHPLQSTEIRCVQDKGLCIETTAIIMEKADDTTTPWLFLDTDLYDIERWDQYEIVTKPKDFGCTRYVRRFHRTAKEVTGLRTTIKNEGKCSGFTGNEIHMRLVKGSEIMKPIWEQQQKDRRGLYLLGERVLRWLK